MYYRFTKVKHDPSKYENIMEYADNTVEPQLSNIEGLIKVQAIRLTESEMMVVAVYDNEDNAAKSAMKSMAIFGGMADMLTAAPEQFGGEIVMHTETITSYYMDIFLYFVSIFTKICLKGRKLKSYSLYLTFRIGHLSRL